MKQQQGSSASAGDAVGSGIVLTGKAEDSISPSTTAIAGTKTQAAGSAEAIAAKKKTPSEGRQQKESKKSKKAKAKAQRARLSSSDVMESLIDDSEEVGSGLIEKLSTRLSGSRFR